MDHELRLSGEPDSVPLARRYVASQLSEIANPSLVADAELAVSELVTNALLHAGTDVLVRVRSGDSTVRIEVYDASRATPLPSRASTGSMTGRGIALVDRLARRWGADPTDEGKVVWCELALDPDADRGYKAESAAPPDLEQWLKAEPPDQSERVFTVEIGDVPTDLLLSAKEHLDNVVREFTLAAGGAASGASAQLPAHMTEMIEAVVHRFAWARRILKQQALVAAARNEPRTRLVLTLPASAADTAEEYLAALDDADAYAHSVRLLTQETPTQHRAFRRWYIHSLVDQLRASEKGEKLPEPPTFEAYLLQELDEAAHAQSALQSLARRLEHLQQLTAELTHVSGTQAIADTVVAHAAEAFGATFASLYLLDGDTLRSLQNRGTTDNLMEPWLNLPVSSELPASEAFRTNAPVVISAGELAQRYPALTEYERGDRSVVCVPLSLGADPIGVITLLFPAQRDVTSPDEIRFLVALADACAQAIDRAGAIVAASDTADKLSFLVDASAQLNASLDYRTTLANLAHLVVPRLADWCSVETMDEGGLVNIAVAHIDPEKIRFAEEIQRRYPTDPSSTTGVPNVIRTGLSELYPVVTDDMLVASAVDDEHLRIARELNLKSALMVPLTANGHTFGAITLCYAESGRTYSEADQRLAENLADRAAQAVEHARQYGRQQGRLATITRIAETAQQAILAPVPPRIGPVDLAASYVSAAEDALVGGDMYEVVPTHGSVRLLIGDVRGKGLDAVRLTTVVLGFFRSTSVEWTSLEGLARQMDARLRPYLDEEDFVTALLVEINDDGRCDVVSCGHPAPLLSSAGGIVEVECPTAFPLGLGTAPTSARLTLSPGDRLLLYTDGLIEARSQSGELASLWPLVAPLPERDLRSAVDRILGGLLKATGAKLDDDLALIGAEYRPD